MAGERAWRSRQTGQDAAAEAVRALEGNGELAHLHGRPLDLGDDSPDWFARRLLKREGALPPVLERGREIDAARREAERIRDRPRRRRAWLLTPSARCTAADAAAFNRLRERTLDDYRAALEEINRAILTYNLMAPPALHRYGIIVGRVVDDMAREIPPLDEAIPGPPSSRPRSRLHAAWQRLRGR